jgi:hypothetical protein
LWVAWIYAFNPVTVMVTAYQGQVDAMTMLWLLLAWYFLAQSHHAGKKLTFSAAALGLAILSKSWPVIFLPIAWLRLRSWNIRLSYPVLVGVVPLVAVLLYEWLFPGSLVPMLRRALRAGSISGWWGYSAILNNMVQWTGAGQEFYAVAVQAGKIISLLGAGVTIYLTRRRSALESLLLVILVLYVTIPNLGLQSLAWLVPLGLILGRWNRIAWYLVGVSLHMIVSYWGIHLTDGLFLLLPAELAGSVIQLSSLTAWGMALLWLVEEVSGRQLLPVIFEPSAWRGLPNPTHLLVEQDLPRKPETA